MYSWQQKRVKKTSGTRFNRVKKIIFPPLPPGKVGLTIDKESFSYITHYEMANVISNLIVSSLPAINPKDIGIVDMTAGVGGNVLSFANHFGFVHAIEIDSLRHGYLINNIKLYEHRNVHCYNTDSVEWILKKNNKNYQAIFFDPPWGGKGYKTRTNLRFRMGEYEIEKLCLMLIKTVSVIAFKLPYNYDFEYFNLMLADYDVQQHALDRMHLIIVRNMPSKSNIISSVIGNELSV